MLAEESLAQKFIKKWFWLYLFTFLTAPLSYLTKIILARDLSMNDYGLFLGVTSLLTLFSAFNDLGASESLNYFLPKYILEKKYAKVKYLLKLVFKLQFLSSLLIIGIIIIFADFIAINHFHDTNAAQILRIISFFFLGINLIHICTALFSATQNTKLQKSTDFIRFFSVLIFSASIFFLDFWSLYNYTLAWIGGVIIAIIFASFYFYKNYYKIYFSWIKSEKDTKLRKVFIAYSIPTFLTANISLLLNQIDVQLVTNILGNSAQWIYGNYISIFSLPFMVLSPFLSFLFPVFSELHGRKNEEKIKFLYQNVKLVLIILTIWISFFFFQNSENLAIFFFGEPYRESGRILHYSLPFLFFNLINSLNFYLLAGTGRAWTRTISFAIALPINIVLNLIFIEKFGVAGSALAVGLSWVPMYIFTAYSTRKYFSFPKILPIFWNFLAGASAFILFYFIEKNFTMSTIFAIGISTIIYTIIFIGINFSLFRKTLLLIKNNS